MQAGYVSILPAALTIAAAVASTSVLAQEKVMSAGQASEVRAFFLFHEMLFETCGMEIGDAPTYGRVWEQFAARNFYHGDVADRVLAHHGAKFDRAGLIGVNRTAARMSLSSAGNATAYCALAGLAVGKGTLDLRSSRPDLFEMLVRSDRVMRAKPQ